MWSFSNNSCPGVSVSGQVYSRITSQQRAGRHVSLPLTFNAKTSPLQTDRRYNVYECTHTHTCTHTPTEQARVVPSYDISCWVFLCFFFIFWFFAGGGENSRCTMSPASAFAIATAAAGHSSSQGKHCKPWRSKRHNWGRELCKRLFKGKWKTRMTKKMLP